LSSNTQTWSSLDAGWYTVTVTQAGCVESDSVEVLLDPDPVANFNFTPPLSNCQPVTYSFVNNSNATNYIWNFGNGEPPSIESSPTQIYLDEPYGNITVTLIVFNNDILCSDTIDTTIDLDVCDCTNPLALNFNPLANIDDGSCTPEVYAPNVFTPNSDAQNPTFFLSGKNIVSLELNILNRWGSVVFSQSSSDLVNNNPSWDGKIDGDLAKEGIYFYIYKATSISNQIVEGHGFLHLILDK
jgi:gliding motility-associated-like protein